MGKLNFFHMYRFSSSEGILFVQKSFFARDIKHVIAVWIECTLSLVRTDDFRVFWSFINPQRLRPLQYRPNVVSFGFVTFFSVGWSVESNKNQLNNQNYVSTVKSIVCLLRKKNETQKGNDEFKENKTERTLYFFRHLVNSFSSFVPLVFSTVWRFCTRRRASDLLRFSLTNSSHCHRSTTITTHF